MPTGVPKITFDLDGNGDPINITYPPGYPAGPPGPPGGHLVTEFAATTDANPDAGVNRFWVGSGEPDNAVQGDFVFDTT